MHGQPIECPSAANSAVPPSLRLWLRRPSTGHDAAGHDAAGHDAEEWGKTMTNPTPEDFPPHNERPEPGRWTLRRHPLIRVVQRPAHEHLLCPRRSRRTDRDHHDHAQPPRQLRRGKHRRVNADDSRPVRDAKIRGSELLDVDRYGTIDFASTGLWPSGEHFLETSPCGAP